MESNDDNSIQSEILDGGVGDDARYIRFFSSFETKNSLKKVCNMFHVINSSKAHLSTSFTLNFLKKAVLINFI